MIDIDQLIALALGDLDPAQTDAVEEHVLACGRCARTLERILLLGDGVRSLVGAGKVRFAVSADLFARLQAAGLITRIYRLGAGGSVACGIAADDIYVATELTAELTGVTQLDVIQHTPMGPQRLVDVPFDPAGVVRTVELAELLRMLPTSQLVLDLISVEPDGDRPIGTYYFNHTAG